MVLTRVFNVFFDTYNEFVALVRTKSDHGNLVLQLMVALVLHILEIQLIVMKSDVIPECYKNPTRKRERVMAEYLR